LTARFNSATRPHVCASMQTGLIWHAVTQLFACWGHSGSFKAPHRLGVGWGYPWKAAGAPLLLTRQFQAQSNRRFCWVAPIIERIDSGCASNPMRVLIRLTEPISTAESYLFVKITSSRWW